MIQRSDILSMEYLNKTEYTGCHRGMRYRLEQVAGEEGKVLKVTVWPEPYNFVKTPEEQKVSQCFPIPSDRTDTDAVEECLADVVSWLNDQYFEQKDKWTKALNNWFK